VLDGDPTAERALYDAHVDRVFRLAYRMTGDAVLAQDFTQDAFIKAFDKLGSFRGEAALSTWLHSVAVSVVINGLRRRTRIRSRELEIEDPEPLAEPRAPRDAGLMVRLGRAVDQLSEILRVVFVMHDLEGYKHREIADILGIPEGTSRARLARAREELRGCMGLEAGVS
jgi:RNA polymerase sigma-70 factor (ECF subfamily)